MRALAWLATASLLLVACGGEDEPPPPPPKSQPVAANPAAKPTRGAGATAGTLTTYAKVEGRPELNPAEVKTIRHRFTANDFVPDPTGSGNRDPFRSYVIAQVNINTGPEGDDKPDPAAQSEKCANKKVAATGYSTHELKLIGVITRGTVRIATFSDTGGVGWVVRRGDCIGSERARVKLIGEGFVTLEYPTAGAAAATAGSTADEREFRLRERELIDEIGTALDEDDESPRIRRRARSPERPSSLGAQPQ